MRYVSDYVRHPSRIANFVGGGRQLGGAWGRCGEVIIVISMIVEFMVDFS